MHSLPELLLHVIVLQQQQKSNSKFIKPPLSVSYIRYTNLAVFAKERSFVKWLSKRPLIKRYQTTHTQCHIRTKGEVFKCSSVLPWKFIIINCLVVFQFVDLRRYYLPYPISRVDCKRRTKLNYISYLSGFITQ